MQQKQNKNPLGSYHKSIGQERVSIDQHYKRNNLREKILNEKGGNVVEISKNKRRRYCFGAVQTCISARVIRVEADRTSFARCLTREVCICSGRAAHTARCPK